MVLCKRKDRSTRVGWAEEGRVYRQQEKIMWDEVWIREVSKTNVMLTNNIVKI